MKYKGIEVKEITTPQVFDPPKQMLIWNDESLPPVIGEVCAIIKHKNGETAVIRNNETWKYQSMWCERWSHCAEIPEVPKSRQARYFVTDKYGVQYSVRHTEKGLTVFPTPLDETKNEEIITLVRKLWKI